VTPQRLWQFSRRWLWLLALGMLVGGALSYVVSLQLPKVYEGRAWLLVTPGQVGSDLANYNQVLAAERLTHTYSEAIMRRPVVEAAIQAGGFNLGYAEASKMLEATPLRDTQFIQISARAADPEVAGKLPNLVAEAFIQQIQASQASRFAASRESLSKQVDQLTTDIAQRAHRAEAVQAQPPSVERDLELASIQFEITQLQQAQAAAARSLEDVRLAEARTSDILTVVEPASPPRTPVQPQVSFNVLLGAVVGLMIAVGVAILREYVDDRVISSERLVRFASLHDLGSVGVMPNNAPCLVVDQPPANGSPPGSVRHDSEAVDVADAFRLLRANLQFATLEHPARVLLVTSSDAGAGKTTIAANLAAVVAQAGERVVLADTDLRQPSLHEVFGLENTVGLTSLLVDQQLRTARVLAPTQVEGLWLLPSGPLPPNPSELLASARMRARLAELRELADLVILDSPPVLAASDAAVLTHLVDGTLLVVDAQHTRGQHVAQAVATLRNAGGQILGAVRNRVAHGGVSRYHYGYRQTRSPLVSPPRSRLWIVQIVGVAILVLIALVLGHRLVFSADLTKIASELTRNLVMFNGLIGQKDSASTASSSDRQPAAPAQVGVSGTEGSSPIVQQPLPTATSSAPSATVSVATPLPTAQRPEASASPLQPARATPSLLSATPSSSPPVLAQAGATSTPAPRPSAPPTTSTAPTPSASSVTTVLQQVTDAEAGLHTGRLEATLDHGRGSVSSATLVFDLGSPTSVPRLHMTATYGNASGNVQSIERITIGDRSWQRQSSGGWDEQRAEEAPPLSQVLAFLPNARSASNPTIESDGNVHVLHWLDASLDEDVTLWVDPSTGVPQRLRRVTHATGTTLTVRYTDWNNPVEITPPQAS